MKWKAVIFDLDGTLLDTIEDIADSMNHVLKEKKFPEHHIDSYKDFVGDGVYEMVMRSLPEDSRDHEIIIKCIDEYRKQYDWRWNNKTHAYPGIPQLLDELTELNMKLTVLSNKTDDFTKIMVKSILGKWHFDIILGQRKGVKIKPDPAGAIEISSYLNISSEQFLFVGDSKNDMKTAVSANMYPVGALWGFRDEKELLLSGAKLLINQPIDLLKFIKID